MATSEARIEANRRNARKSTGPRTDEGKAASRGNAFRHGLAGAGDLLAPGEDAARVEARAATFARELGAVGEAGAILARRAAVLSLRMERAAARDLAVVAADRAEALARFDEERAERVEELIGSLRVEGSERTDALVAAQRLAFRALEALPEGVAPLVEVWTTLGSALRSPNPATVTGVAECARLWLGLAGEQVAGWSANRWAERVAHEVARLRHVDAGLEPERRAIARAREEAGLLATFDPSPDACLARRHELAAERGFFRALKAIRDLRASGPLPSFDPAPEPQPAPPPSRPASPQSAPSATPPAPAPAIPLGSFRAHVEATPAPAIPPLAAPLSREEHRRRRPDPRHLAATRR